VRFKDAFGTTRTVATGVRDESAARSILVEMEKRIERVKSGILSPEEDAAADHRRSEIGQHIERYLASLRARGDGERHVRNQKRLMGVVFTECSMRSLADVKRETIESWLTTGANVTRSARTKNMYVGAVRGLMRWCVETGRLLVDPTARIRRANEAADRRRQPRALTEDELVRLFDAARRRPLEEARLCRRGFRKNQPGARLKAGTIAKLERLGLERATAYKTMLLSGLRLGELSKIRGCDVVLDSGNPHIALDARIEKNREGSTIPLRADLAEDLRRWIVNRSSIAPLFRLSANQVKTFDRDLKYAGISKHDERGRTVCVHSLRHSFATMMSRAGVAPRVAQAAMRHASVEMTLQTYTDARLLDIAGALTTLPKFELTPGGHQRLPAETRTN
jgi:integrase